jgi:prepilin-type N-terminal cleavage/methylation domain-containing protein/prepilin-type processing-associated H-X9-DG protein
VLQPACAEHGPIRNQGFSLVELLVVVTIIAILISMLMPAFKLMNAKDSVCANNERQIMTAGAAYGLEHNGFLPSGAGLTPGSWSPTWDQLLLNYGATLDTLLCPRQKEGTRHYWVNSNYINAYKTWGNRQQTGVMSLGFSVRPARVTNPANTVSWMEMRWRYAGFADGGTSVPGGGWASIAWDYQDYFIIQLPHLQKANYVFLDTHVALMNIEEALVPDGAGGYTFERMKRRK